MSKKPPPIGFLADFDEPPPTAPPPPPPKESDTSNTPVSPSSPKGNRPKIELTWIDKIYRFFYSKQEFEAYLIEKELKRRAKKEREEARKAAQRQYDEEQRLRQQQ